MDRTAPNGAQLEYMTQGLGGIMLAGALFSFLAYSIGFALTVWIDGYPPLGEAAGTYIMGALIFVSVSTILCLASGYFSVVAVWLFNMSLGNPLDHRAATLSSGSLAGYIPTACFLFSFEWGLFLIPFFAMAVGAFGATWSARGYLPHSWRPQIRETKFKLSILRLMIATAWAAVFLAMANLFGSTALLIAVVVWFIFNGSLIGFARLYRSFRPALSFTF